MTLAWYSDTITQDLARASKLTLLWGFEGIVLRTLDGARVPDLNLPKVKYRLSLDELAVVAIEPGLFEGEANDRAGWLGDLSLLDDSLQFCTKVGCDTVITGALPGDDLEIASEALSRVVRAAERYGIRVAVRNEGQARARAKDLVAMLERCGDHAPLVCWDPLVSHDSGDELIEAAESLAPHLGILHVRGSKLRGGQVEWEAVIRRLASRGFNGSVVMDATGLETKQALRTATELIYAVRRATGGEPS